MTSVRTVIHVSPHPDDESIAAPCTLLALQRNGWRVVNLAVSFGRSSQQGRREAELKRALERTQVDGSTGFALRTPESPIGISRGDDLRVATQRLTRELRALVESENAELIIGPHPKEGHHGHVVAARAIRQTVWTSRRPLVWWMWSLWADLPRPTLIVDCDPADLETAQLMLKEYSGETWRTNYEAGRDAALVKNAAFGIERAIGWGASQPQTLAAISRAELLTELKVERGRWFVSLPRLLDAGDALAGRWERLDDYSILSPARFRRLLRPWVLSWLSRIPVDLTRTGAEPLPSLDPDEVRRWGPSRPVPPARS